MGKKKKGKKKKVSKDGAVGQPVQEPVSISQSPLPDAEGTADSAADVVVLETARAPEGLGQDDASRSSGVAVPPGTVAPHEAGVVSKVDSSEAPHTVAGQQNVTTLEARAQDAEAACVQAASQVAELMDARQDAEDRVAQVLIASSAQLESARKMEEELARENADLQRQLADAREACSIGDAEKNHLRAQVEQQRAEIESLKVSRPSVSTSPPQDASSSQHASTELVEGRREVEDARTRLEKEKWRRVAQAAEKAAKQAMDETAAAKQEIDDLRSTHSRVETALRNEAVKTRAENDELRARVQQLERELQATQHPESQQNSVEPPAADLVRQIQLLKENLASKDALLASVTESMQESEAKAQHDRKTLQEALASAKQEASVMEDLLRSEAAAMEANMMDAFQKDGQRELDKMRQKLEANTKEAVALAKTEAEQVLAAQQAQAARDIQHETQAAKAVAAQLAEITNTHAGAMLLQEQECAALEVQLQTTKCELTASLDSSQAKHEACVAAQAQVAQMTHQIEELHAARQAAEETLAAERLTFENKFAAVAESNSASQSRTAERLHALQNEVDRLQETQVSLRDAEAELAELGLKCAKGVAAQAQVSSLRASNDAAQVELARLRSSTEEAEARTAEALRTAEVAKAEALQITEQATEQAAEAQLVAEQARHNERIARETEATEVAAAQQHVEDARKAMGVAEEHQKAAECALESGRRQFEAELRAAHSAHEQVIQEAVLTIVRDEEAKAAAAAAAFNEKLLKTEGEYEAMIAAAAEREKAAALQMTLAHDEMNRLRKELQQGDALTAGFSTAGVQVNPQVQTGMISSTVCSKPAMHRHPRAPDRSSSPVQQDLGNPGSQTMGAAVVAPTCISTVSKVQIHASATASSSAGGLESGGIVAVNNNRHTTSPHKSTPAPRKFHKRIVGPRRPQATSDDGYGTLVDVVSSSSRPQSRSSTLKHEETGNVMHDVRAASKRRVPSMENSDIRTYSPQALEKLDSAVDQWVQASAITPPPNSVASSSGQKDSHGDISHGREELWDFDVDEGENPRRFPRGNRDTNEVKHLLPKLPANLSCRPTLAEMSQMHPADLAAVKDFTITRTQYGSIWCVLSDDNYLVAFSITNTNPHCHFVGCMSCVGSFDVEGHDLTDVRGLDLRRGGGDSGALVWVGKPGLCTAVELYPGAAGRYKPPIGHGINKPASISLSFRSGLDECRLRLALAQQPGVFFQSYDPQTGTVAFRVAHF